MLMEEQVVYDKLLKYRSQNKELDRLEIYFDEGNIDLESNLISIINQFHVLEQNQVSTSVRDILMEAGIKGKLAWIKKKIVRWFNFFYVQPICDQQTIYNSSVTHCIERLLEINLRLLRDYREIEKEKDQMQQELRQIRKEVKECMRMMRGTL